MSYFADLFEAAKKYREEHKLPIYTIY